MWPPCRKSLLGSSWKEKLGSHAFLFRIQSMNVSEFTRIRLSDRIREEKPIFSKFGSVPHIVSFSGGELYVYRVTDGSLIRQLHSPDRIEKVTECTFSGYGNCIAALSYSYCNIWNEEGELFSVVLPCRMQAMYPIDNGLVFERIEDLFSMNTSFSISTPIHSIPMYFSLTSPMSIPKPILQKQEGEDLSVTALNLSRIMNTSMDLFSSRIADNLEHDLSIIGIVPEIHLLFLYKRSVGRHSFLRWVSTSSASIGLQSEEAVLDQMMKDDGCELNDAFIQQLCGPEMCLDEVFQGMESSTAYSRLFWIQADSTVFLYCQEGCTIQVYQVGAVFFLDKDSMFPMNIEYVCEIQGTAVGRMPDTPFLLVRFNTDEWGIVVGSSVLISGKQEESIAVVSDSNLGMAEEKEDRVTEYCFSDGILIEYSEPSLIFRIVQLPLDCVNSKLLSLANPLLNHVHYSNDGIQIDADEQTLLFLADYFWILNDEKSLNECITRLSNHILKEAYYLYSPLFWEKVDPSMQLPLPMILRLRFIDESDERIQERMNLYANYQQIEELPFKVLKTFLGKEMIEDSSFSASPLLLLLSLFGLSRKKKAFKYSYERNEPSVIQEVHNLIS